MKRLFGNFIRNDERGSAVVEATILFPVMIMVFAGLVLLAIYLPGRAELQRATQYVATGMATARSDSSIDFDKDGYKWVGGDSEFRNVYAALFNTDISSTEARDIIVEKFDSGFIASGEDMTITCGVNNYVVYKEVFVTATKTVESPVDLSFVGFPETIDMTVTSTAVVQNGDEFVRNLDLTVEFINYLAQKANIDLGKAMEKVEEVLGWLHN